MQTDLEEAKGQEITKLQNSLQDMQSKVDETKEMVVKEREAAQKAIEEASSVVKETPVLVQDTERIETLSTEVKNLKVLWLLHLLSCLKPLTTASFKCVIISLYMVLRLHLQ